MPAKPEAAVGAHRLVFEADDIITLHFGPSIDEAEINQLLRLQTEHVQGKPYFLIIDLTRIGSIPEPVRRAVGQASKRLRMRGIAMFGGSFQLRVMVRLLNTALALLGKSPFPQEFFGSHDAAMAWVMALRQQQPAAGA